MNLQDEDKREFKGIWIPKSIWLNRTLSVLEKVLLIEIDSLDDPQNGCWKSNKRFAEFFDMSESRISELITSLKNKGYITVQLTRTNEGFKRSIRVITTSEIRSPQHFDNPKSAHRNVEVRTSEKADIGNTEGGNTVEDNFSLVASAPSAPATKKPTAKKANSPKFEEAWQEYPKRGGSNPKDKAAKAWNARVKEGVPEDELLAAVKRYKAYCVANRMLNTRYVAMTATFFGTDGRYKEDYRIENKNSTSFDRTADLERAAELDRRHGVDYSVEVTDF